MGYTPVFVEVIPHGRYGGLGGGAPIEYGGRVLLRGRGDWGLGGGVWGMGDSCWGWGRVLDNATQRVVWLLVGHREECPLSGSLA